MQALKAYGQDAGSAQRWPANMKTSTSNDKRRLGAVLVAFLLTVLSSRQVRATEESAWAFLGFSDDGDYAAVEIFGVHGDESPHSTIRIINTKANQFVGPPISTCMGRGQGCEDAKNPNATQKEARTRNRLKAKEALASHRIDANLQGEWTKLSAKQRSIVDQGSGDDGMAIETIPLRWQGVDWNLVLQEVPAPGGKNAGYGQPRMIDLRLQKNGNEFSLQKDRAIPRSRGTGIYSYGLDTAITYRNTLLVVLRYARPGRDGSEITQLFVTAGAM
jgi:predicted secreted protein